MRLKHFETLKSARDFDYLYRNAHKFHTPGFIFFFLKDKRRRVGFTVSKKIGNAVARNLAKRRLRAMFVHYADEMKCGQYVFVAKNAMNELDFLKMKKDFKMALKKTGALENIPLSQ